MKEMNESERVGKKRNKILRRKLRQTGSWQIRWLNNKRIMEMLRKKGRNEGQNEKERRKKIENPMYKKTAIWIFLKSNSALIQMETFLFTVNQIKRMILSIQIMK